MRGTLAAQAQIVWGPEREILRRRYGERLGAVLDLGCGTGEILGRVRKEFECAGAVGVDLFHGHLRHARAPVAVGDGFRLPFAAETFDLVLVRHLLQALEDPVPLLAEARRVLRPGGRVHVVAEDYMALFFDTDDPAVENHFAEVQPRFRERGTDLYQGPTRPPPPARRRLRSDPRRPAVRRQPERGPRRIRARLPLLGRGVRGDPRRCHRAERRGDAAPIRRHGSECPGSRTILRVAALRA